MNIKNHKLALLGIPSKWKRHYRNLLSLREELQADRVGQAEAFRVAPKQQLMLAILSNATDPLFEVNAAIRRIEDGTYGICEESGKPISEERLRVVPWTRFTMEVLARMERARAGSSRSLPERRGNNEDNRKFALILCP